MGVVCKYKYDSSIYADFIPEFNSEYSGYVITDEVEGNIITRTIESDKLPTMIRFGRVYVEGEATTDNRTDSLLEVLNMNTSGLTSMHSMFRYNKNLTSIICEWDTSNVTNMAHMFASCHNLTSLNVSNWNTSKVTTMRNMFYNCNKLTTLDVSNFNTSNVTDMYCMFYRCYKLTTLDVSNFDTSNVTDMRDMFTGCNKLTTLDVSNFNTSNVTGMQNIFYNCNNLTTLDVSNFDTSNVTTMRGMFYGCNNLTSLNISNWDTSNVINMQQMFYDCNNLTTLDVSNFNTSNVTTMYCMFANCKSLTSLDLSNFDTSNVTNTTDIFANTNSLEVIAMFNSDINTINTIGNLTSATIYVDESLDQSQYTGTAPLKVYKEEKLEIKLNSPLLEGDTIEVVDGKLCHYHKMGIVVLDGSEDWSVPGAEIDNTIRFSFHSGVDAKGTTDGGLYFCESFPFSTTSTYGNSIEQFQFGVTEVGRLYLRINKSKLTEVSTNGLKQWLSKNPTTLIYKLNNPTYEDITPLQSSIVLKTFLESSMTIDTILPIETKLSYRTNVPSISTLSTRATELAESDNVIHNLMNIIDDEVDE